MLRRNIKSFIKIGIIGGACTGTVLSLRANNYDINSIGIVRLGRSARTVCDISLNYKYNLYNLNLDKKSPEYKEQKSKCHYQAAEKLLELCCQNKGVYIKVGQHVAALDYLLPHEFVKTMRILHNHAPATDLEDIRKVIREDFHKEPEEVFTTFDPEPIGAASLAQVHKATLPDGTIVAVKVQHPCVQGNSRVDLRTMEILVKIVSKLFPDFKFQWLVDEIKKNIPRELDFTQEAHNAEKLRDIYCKKYDWLKVPKVLWDLTTSRVLTMEFVEGGQINDPKYIKSKGIDPYEVSDKLGLLYSQMIFTDGFMHSDPHPGNILVKKRRNGKCEIIMLDHGLYSNLSREFRSEYAELWLSILNVDRNAMRDHSINLGIRPELYGLFTCIVTGRTWESVLHGVDKSGPRTKNESHLMRETLPSILPEISDILDTVNSQMLLVLRTNDLIRGIEYALGTYDRMSAFKTMSNCCIRATFAERIRKANNFPKKFLITVQQYWTLFRFTLYYVITNLFRGGVQESLSVSNQIVAKAC